MWIASRCPQIRPRGADSSAKPVGVLAAVVGEVLARLDRLPPVAAGAVPLDRLGETVLEAPLRPPAERAPPRRVEGVAAVVTGPIGHVADEPRVGARQLEDAARDLDVLELVAAADVVDLARDAFAQD